MDRTDRARLANEPILRQVYRTLPWWRRAAIRWDAVRVCMGTTTGMWTWVFGYVAGAVVGTLVWRSVGG